MRSTSESASVSEPEAESDCESESESPKPNKNPNQIPNPSLALAVPLDLVQTLQYAIVSRKGGGSVSAVGQVPLLPVAARSAKRQTVNVWRRRSMIMMEIGLASSTTVRRCSPKAMRSEEDPKLAKLIPFDMLMKATGNMYPCPFMAAVLSPMLADNCISKD